jgi:hypothetical protein
MGSLLGWGLGGFGALGLLVLKSGKKDEKCLDLLDNPRIICIILIIYTTLSPIHNPTSLSIPFRPTKNPQQAAKIVSVALIIYFCRTQKMSLLDSLV